MRKVFISYHHANDQFYKDSLSHLNSRHRIFIDKSVDVGNVSDNLPTQRIRQIIRDEYLRDSTVTVLLVGRETRHRKHVDWELKSSMINGTMNKKSGVLVIMLPSTGCTNFFASHGAEEKKFVYPSCDNWVSHNSVTEFKDQYPYLPDRIADNMIVNGSNISITNWDVIYNDPAKLEYLIETTAKNASNATYDLARPMRMRNG